MQYKDYKLNSKIQHKGIIYKVEEHLIHVKILQEAACISCKTKFMCNSTESKEKIIEVVLPDHKDYDYQVGEEVLVNCSSAAGLKATWYAFLIPLLIVVASLVILTQINIHEGMASLISLILLLLYFLSLYFFKDKFKKKFIFTLTKL